MWHLTVSLQGHFSSTTQISPTFKMQCFDYENIIIVGFFLPNTIFFIVWHSFFIFKSFHMCCKNIHNVVCTVIKPFISLILSACLKNNSQLLYWQEPEDEKQLQCQHCQLGVMNSEFYHIWRVPIWKRCLIQYHN